MNQSDEEWWAQWEEKMRKISELEKQLGIDTSSSRAKWEKKMKKITELEKQLGVDRDSIVTKEEYDWVEQELKQVDKLYNEMYGE